MDYLRSMSKVKRRLVFPLVALVVFALVGVIPASADLGYNTGELPDNCVKFESEDLETGTKTSADGSFVVTLSAWTELDDDGEPHDFDFIGPDPGDLSYFKYKAGNATFAGAVPSEEKAISNVVFCGPQDGGGEETGPPGTDEDPTPTEEPVPSYLRIDKALMDSPAGATFGFTATPVGGGDPLAFAVDTSSVPFSSNTKAIGPGTYELTESADANWYWIGIACAGATIDSTVAGPFGGTISSATITVAEGAEVVCTFTNFLDTGVE